MNGLLSIHVDDGDVHIGFREREILGETQVAIRDEMSALYS